MKFLKTTTYKDSIYALSAEKRTEVAAAAIAYHEKYIKAGKLKDVYTFADGKLVSIWNVESLEEMLSINLQHPYLSYVESQTEPFVDHEALVKMFNDARAAAKKAANK